MMKLVKIQKGLMALMLVGGANASELVYTPVNPAFGGNPMNGSVLLNEAQAQNDFQDPKATGASGYKQKTALEQFNDTLQQYVLNRVAASVSSGLFGANGQLIPGTLETNDFIITIVEISPGVLQISTIDKSTGQTTSFEISQ